VTDSSDLPALRASDADRERVADLLHRATVEGRLTAGELEERLQQAYAAKTFADLEVLTRDLPADAGTSVATRIGGTPGATKSLAVMSGFDRKGNWVVPAHHQAVAIMGGGTLDLRNARFAARETTIRAFAIMGGIEIKVPDDVTVHVDGIGFMGGFSDHAAGDADPGAPIIRVTGFAFWGGVDVKRSKRWRKQLQR
jgi:hypothetical protein